MSLHHRRPAPETSMLLASDGSTTRLLEALTGQRLEARVLTVTRTVGTTLRPSLRDLLRAGGETTVLIRTTALLDEEGTEVSRNLVVASGELEPDLARCLAGTTPIGKVLSARWPGHRRTLLEAGRTHWETDGPGRACASKSYVIDNVGSGNVLFLEERFNPDIVPPAGLPPLPPHAPYFQAAAS